MNVALQTRVREFIDDLVRLAEAAPSQKELAAQVMDAVKASGASDRDVALAFSTLVTSLQKYLDRPRAAGELVICSFCQKSQRDVKTIVQGPAASICN